jgi:hypothetical protein
MAGLMRVGDVVRANVYSLNDAAAAAAMWRDDAQADADEFVAAAKAVKKFWANVDAANAAKSQAATIIQAAERGRVVRMVVVSVADATEVLRLSKFVLEDWAGIAVARAVVAMGVAGLMKTKAVGLVEAVVECHAATIIQATARGRAVRAWNTRFTEGFAQLLLECEDECNSGSHRRERQDEQFEYVILLFWLKRAMAERFAQDFPCVAWIELAERRRRVKREALFAALCV